MGTWICWAVVGVTWGIGALRDAAPAARRDGRDFASLAGVVAAVIAVTSPDAVWRPLTVAAPWPRLVGLVVLIAATAFTVRARLALGAMWSSAPIAKPAHALRTTGPYRVTRHPIYTGVLAMLIGTALTQGLGRWIAVLGAVAVVLLMKTGAEERLLLAEFGPEYERYRARVPRLLPWPR